MRTSITVLLPALLLLCFTMQAQQGSARVKLGNTSVLSKPTSTADPVQTNPELVPPGGLFVGTWRGQSGNDVVELVLTRDTAYKLPDESVHTAMLGRHKLTRNGVVIEQSFTSTPITLIGSPYATRELDLAIFDMTKQKWCKLALSLTTPENNQIRWVLTPKLNVVTINSPQAAGFTLPRDMVLTKVE